jgi:DTW domain-containing protein YfiP
VITQLLPEQNVADSSEPAAAITKKRPLFILLDATWPEARKIFKKARIWNSFLC